MSSSSTGRPPQMGSTAAQLAHRAFTATRPGLTTQVPLGHESLMWVADSATLIYGKRDAALVNTVLTIDQGVDLADRIAAGGKNVTRRLFPGEIPDEPGLAEITARMRLEWIDARELYPDCANPGSLWGVANAAKGEAGSGVPGTATAARHEETAATGGAS